MAYATVTPSRATAPSVEGLLDQRRLLYVTGKGGSGKTTVAVALGLVAAPLRQRTIVCELAGPEQVPRAFGTVPAAYRETRLTSGLWSLSVDPQAALREWLRRRPGGAVAEAVLSRSAAFEQFVAAAPGAKELIAIGKVVELTGRGPDVRPEPPYDLVVVDGPSTGHALGMLAAPAAVGRAAPVGPVGAQARALHDLLADAATTGYVGVSLPEEMSVREVLDLEQRLHDVVGHGLDLIIVDGVYPDRFSDEEAERIQALATRKEASALRAALHQHRRARIHTERVRSLRAQARAPVITLPYVFTAAIGPAEYARLARELAAALGDGS